MVKFIKRIVFGKKGAADALATVLLAALAFFIVQKLASSGNQAADTAGSNINGFVGGGN